MSERALWIAVIGQQFVDATQYIDPLKLAMARKRWRIAKRTNRRNILTRGDIEIMGRDNDRRDAITYLTNRSPSLVEVCRLAGLEVEYVMRKANERLREAA